MQYHVSRGLREIVAPRQTMSTANWKSILSHFEGACAYCGSLQTQENRGIVADHVIPATSHGEFVLGNIIPACQTCNDSRGNKCWKEFIKSKSISDLEARISKIEQHLLANPYVAPIPESVLTAEELRTYNEILRGWEEIHRKAKELYKSKHG